MKRPTDTDISRDERNYHLTTDDNPVDLPPGVEEEREEEEFGELPKFTVGPWFVRTPAGEGERILEGIHALRQHRRNQNQKI